uniref:Uncharacterized protein n=2 Tax=Hemiselmis andersenii TaxID=464988 RepID=A0A7S1DJL6_HEMAN|mmetsp:Transcript_16210/g.39128  ORF Transcript_16210/g.39128 Transcript_16210/m.39128 type:complete len:191 (+) Transcript_16210:3-575(+)
MRERGEISDFNAIVGDARAWREVEEIAESEWRFYDPEQYYAYEQLRDKRDEMLGIQRAREERIMSIAAEAEVSLDEFVGVMIDLGFTTNGNELVTADPFMSVISGKGREFGVDVGLERALYKFVTFAFVGIVLSPIAFEIARAAPLAQAGLQRELDGLAASASSTVGVVEHLGGWGFVLRALLLGDSSYF